MFSGLFFLILVVLIVDLTPQAHPLLFPDSPWAAAAAGLALYAALLGVIVLQNRLLRRRWSHSRRLAIANVEILTTLVIAYFVIGAHRLYYPPSETLLAAVSLSAYLLALACFHRSSPPGNAWPQIRFLAPFLLPFLLLALLSDIAALADLQDLPGWLMLPSLLLFLSLLAVVMPPAMVLSWGCEPLTQEPLRARLDALCRRAAFRHAGIRVWNASDHIVTAAIVGFLPRFRYLLLTRDLIARLSDDEIEAVLCHEIGHNTHRHLWRYPWILVGLVVASAWVTLLLGPAVDHFFSLNTLLTPSPLWSFLYPLGLLVAYAVGILAYIRVLFGYFSRQFERQADLHVFALGLPPEALIAALEDVAAASGQSLHQPSWHHYSLQQRIDCLRNAAADSTSMSRHGRRVRRDFLIYLTLLAAASVVPLAEAFPKAPGLGGVASWIHQRAYHIDHSLTGPWRRQLVEKVLVDYDLQKEEARISQIALSLDDYGALRYPGLLEFYAAQRLWASGDVATATTLMAGAWERFDFSQADPSVEEDFVRITEGLLEAGARQPKASKATERLRDAMKVHGRRA